MYRTLLWVTFGSGIGGVTRFLIQQRIYKLYPSSFPWGTFTVNIIGCFIIGIIYALGEKGNLLSSDMRLFLATGFCGGFTTFSSFAYENISLLKDNELFFFIMYTTFSILIGFAAVYAGILLVKSL
jgi:fluoride exporter